MCAQVAIILDCSRRWSGGFMGSMFRKWRLDGWFDKPTAAHSNLFVPVPRKRVLDVSWSTQTESSCEKERNILQVFWFVWSCPDLFFSSFIVVIDTSIPQKSSTLHFWCSTWDVKNPANNGISWGYGYIVNPLSFWSPIYNDGHQPHGPTTEVGRKKVLMMSPWGASQRR